MASGLDLALRAISLSQWGSQRGWEFRSGVSKNRICCHIACYRASVGTLGGGGGCFINLQTVYTTALPCSLYCFSSSCHCLPTAAASRSSLGSTLWSRSGLQEAPWYVWPEGVYELTPLILVKITLKSHLERQLSIVRRYQLSFRVILHISHFWVSWDFPYRGNMHILFGSAILYPPFRSCIPLYCHTTDVPLCPERAVTEWAAVICIHLRRLFIVGLQRKTFLFESIWADGN